MIVKVGKIYKVTRSQWYFDNLEVFSCSGRSLPVGALVVLVGMATSRLGCWLYEEKLYYSRIYKNNRKLTVMDGCLEEVI